MRIGVISDLHLYNKTVDIKLALAKLYGSSVETLKSSSARRFLPSTKVTFPANSVSKASMHCPKVLLFQKVAKNPGAQTMQC